MKSKDSNIYCDIDETLIKDCGEKEPDVVFEVNGEWFYKLINKSLIERLKQQFQTKFIIIWTSNSLGIEYAEVVVREIGLDKHTDLILIKPNMVIDDSPGYDWFQNFERMEF